MKFKIPLFFLHLVVCVVVAAFEIYFITSISVKSINLLFSPYIIGLIIGVLLTLLTYLMVRKDLATIVSFLPSIFGALLILIIFILYIWKTQSLDGSGYFFTCAFLGPFVVLSALWSFMIYLINSIEDENQTRETATQ